MAGGVITLGTEEQFYRDVAYKALVKTFGEKVAKELIDNDEIEDVSEFIQE